MILFLALRASGPIARAESCLSAEVSESGFATAPIGLNSGVNAKKREWEPPPWVLSSMWDHSVERLY